MSNNYTEIYETIYKGGYHKDIELTHTKHILPLLSNLTNEIIKKSPKNLNVLDVGCSHGKGMKLMQELGYNVLGTDISETAVNAAIERGFDAPNQVKVGSATALPFEDDRVDIITTSDVLEHIYPEDVPKVLQEFRRVGSYVVSRIALAPEKQRGHLLKAHRDGTLKTVSSLHPSVFSPVKWHGLFVASGFTRLDYRVIKGRNRKPFKYDCVYARA